MLCIKFSDGCAYLWDTFSGDAIGQPLRGHARVVVRIVINTDGTCFVWVDRWDYM